MALLRCSCGCGETVPISLSNRPRLYMNNTHKGRVAERKRIKSGKAAKASRRYRTSVRGRRCRWCKIDDSQVAWSSNRTECQTCSGQRRRPRCPRCDGPFYTRTNKKTGRGVGCLVAIELPPGLDCRNESR